MAGRGNSPQVAITALFTDDNEVPQGDNGAIGGSGYPTDVKTEVGYGCNADDVQRGFVALDGMTKPEYDLDNYKSRGNLTHMSDKEWEAKMAFRSREQFSRGFLNRNATDRNR